MGHAVNSDREYRLLQRRLDCNVTGAPESPAFTKILRLLFSPEEADLARRLPGRPTSIGRLSRKLGIDQRELTDRLTEMAHRGVVFDLEHDGQRYFCLPPVVVGFYEFTFMRTRDDLPLAELAKLFDEYMNQEKFVRAVFQGQTHIGRTLVQEQTLPTDDHTEILDWERASHLVQSASSLGVSLCVCRHKAEHLGEACHRPQRCCLSLNWAAEAMAQSGHAERITAAEGIKILEQCKEAGLAQTGDNVQRQVSYICNCCRCCCGMFHAIRDFDAQGAVVSSNWIMEVDAATCTGCGKCAKACPVEAVRIVGRDTIDCGDTNDPGRNRAGRRVSSPNRSSAIGEESGRNGKNKIAVRDESLCLGCGVCYSACQFGGITMKPRRKRIHTPETVFDRVVTMAVERGKLAGLIVDDQRRLSHRALARVLTVLERSPVMKATLAIRPLRSAFLRGLVRGAKSASGRLRELME